MFDYINSKEEIEKWVKSPSLDQWTLMHAQYSEVNVLPINMNKAKWVYQNLYSNPIS